MHRHVHTGRTLSAWHRGCKSRSTRCTFPLSSDDQNVLDFIDMLLNRCCSSSVFSMPLRTSSRHMRTCTPVPVLTTDRRVAISRAKRCSHADLHMQDQRPRPVAIACGSSGPYTAVHCAPHSQTRTHARVQAHARVQTRRPVQVHSLTCTVCAHTCTCATLQIHAHAGMPRAQHLDPDQRRAVRCLRRASTHAAQRSAARM